jgi:hypothetical protein
VRVKNVFRVSLSVAVAISFWVFVAALPPFRIGIWVDSECVLVVAHLILTVIGLCLSLLWCVTKKLWCSNHTLVFACFAVFSLLVTWWAKNPVVHHFGVPLLGEGSVLFCGLSLLSFGIDNANERKFIYWSAIAAGSTAGILIFSNHPVYGLNINSNWLPYVFGAFLAPIALGIYTLSILTNNKIVKVAIVLLSLALLALSHNKTALIAVVIAIFVWLVTKKTKHGYFLQKIICANIPLLSVGAIYILSSWPAFSSLESRKFAIQSYMLAWQESPLSLLIGNGWGYYFENLQKHIITLPVGFFNNYSWEPSWDGIERLDFHCMHFGVEALFSMGIMGLALYITLILISFSEQNYEKNAFNTFLFAMVFGCLTSTWFTLICVWPFFVLGFSILDQQKLNLARAPLPIVYLLISTAFCAWATVTYWQTAVLYPTNSKSLFYNFTNSKSMPAQNDIKAAYNYHGFHLGHFFLNTLKKIDRMPYSLIVAELNLVFSAYDPKTSPLVLDVALLHGIFHFSGDEHKKHDLWEKVANAVLQKAPKRTDLLVAYITELIGSKQLEKAKSFIMRMLNTKPDDPFALWLNGIYHAYEGEIGQGKALMIKALSQGIEKWIFIPENLQNQLNGKSFL